MMMAIKQILVTGGWGIFSIVSLGIGWKMFGYGDYFYMSISLFASLLGVFMIFHELCLSSK